MTWRLLVDPPASGAENMALDQAIAEAVAMHLVPPTLRIYRWAPPAVSLGWGQDAGECDRTACAASGWDVVRRPTGGRAVLHDATEVTYAVMLPLTEAPDGVLAAYRWLAQGLLEGLGRLGLAGELAAGKREGARSAACFDAPALYEIVVDGRKVIGSAQVRRAGYLLQHGSVPLTFDPMLHVQLLALGGGERMARWLLRQASGLADVSDRSLDWDEVAQALIDGFATGLGLEFEPGGHEPWEIERARQLRALYADPASLERPRPPFVAPVRDESIGGGGA